jgi:type IV secretion system protein VirB11
MHYTQEQTERLHESLRRVLGERILDALSDDGVTDILGNSDGRVFIDKVGEGQIEIDNLDYTRAESILSTVASLTGEIVNSDSPVLECVFPLDGSRFEGMVPPTVERPAFALRKHSKHIYTLDSYVSSKILHSEYDKVIRRAVRTKKNIIVAGGTGSGKTTFVNAVLQNAVEVGEPGERYLVIEDTKEIQCKAKNLVSMFARTRQELPMLCQAAMRMRPDRVVVGEVRGREAYDLMYLLNSGHPGSITTLHANSARLALHKFEMLARESGENVSPQRIVESFDLVMFIERTETGRTVSEVVEIRGHDGSDYVVTEVKERKET